jgi:sensor histidine kinase YesM
MHQNARFWAAIVGINLAAASVANFAIGGVSWHSPLRVILETSAVSCLFSTCCSTLCIVALPRLVPLARQRISFPLYWAIIVVALIGFASVGSLSALLILVAIGYLRSTDMFFAWFAGSLKVSIIVTLLFGVFGTIIEMLRAERDAAALALRTKERDEADARRVAAEAQLASLESRVHPHFLFNTLNSIAALVHDDPVAAERMTTQLASLLRSSLDQHARLVPLDEELGTVRNYLAIERVRFGDRLRYAIAAADDIGDARVPRLALQTLVENSVKYAVTPSRNGASIAVRTTRTNGRLRVDVEDDGPGFDASTVPPGHGLALLRDRLALTFGDRAVLRIAGAPGATIVSLELPVEVEPH